MGSGRGSGRIRRGFWVWEGAQGKGSNMGLGMWGGSKGFPEGVGVWKGVVGLKGALGSQRGSRGLRWLGSQRGVGGFGRVLSVREGSSLSKNPQYVCNNPKYFCFYT